jgi:hypothetical protein
MGVCWPSQKNLNLKKIFFLIKKLGIPVIPRFLSGAKWVLPGAKMKKNPKWFQLRMV